MQEKVSVVIPAYNEAGTICNVLERVLRYLPEVHEIVVVDDASQDRTTEVCAEYARTEPRINVLRHRRNQGKTGALKTGFAACTGTVIVVQDADLEYDPSELPDLLEPIETGRADVCLGSRFMVRRAGRALYFRHYVANKFLTFVSNVLTDLNLTDVETGYKAGRTEILQSMVIESAGFGFEIEFVAKCKKAEARIYEVPISYYGRTYAEGKKIGLKDGIDALWYLIKFNLLRTKAQSFRPGFGFPKTSGAH
ncbi:MAG TPA: glycosyltransferase family 2 protein [Chthoniobacterales bacterium]